ncbi:MAG TPA: alcohol dehydrogenase, partial [Planctomycetes bacterium]|nr:alcohol dehydrogenase [Planctomycetota bacterium]
TRDDRLALGTRFGADVTINVRTQPPHHRLEQVLEAAGGRGADCVVDTAGTPQTLAESLSWLRPGGRYVNAGVAVPSANVPLDVYDLARRNLTIKGAWVSNTRHFIAAVSLVQSRRFPFGELATHRLPLANAHQALTMGKQLGALKVVLLP